MKANELRIGNYYNSHGTFKKATSNTIEELFESENRIWIQPIPITEEILLKCGFGKALNQYKLKTETNPFIILFLEEQFQYDDLRYRTNLEYLHQLQNLYFALTGEELEINL